MSNRFVVTYSKLANILVIIYLSFYFFRFLFNEGLGKIIAVGILLTIAALVALNVKSKNNKLNAQIPIFLLILSGIGTLNTFAGNNFEVKATIQVILSPFVVLALLQFPVNLKIYRPYYILMLGYFVYFALSGKPPDEMFFISRNYISIYTILLLSIYYIGCEQNSKTINLSYPIATLFICIWAVGRSGIAAAALLLLVGLAFSRNTKTSKIVIAGLLVTITTFLLLNIDFAGAFHGIERFQQMGVEDIRREINERYINKTFDSARNFFFGPALNEMNIVRQLDGNPHNSYIKLHIHYGVVGFIIIGTAIVTSIYKLILRREFVIAGVLVSSLLRSATDVSAFYGPLDIIIFYCILYPYAYSTMIKSINSKNIQQHRPG